MKLSTLIGVVALLAVLSTAVFWAGRTATPAAIDPRVGQPLADPAALASAAQLVFSDQGRTIVLARQAGGSWRDVSYFGLPADFSKLASFVNDLTTAKIQRLVTVNPDRIARLEFKDTKIEFLDSSGRSLWSVTLGKNADSGGRFVRFGRGPAAYLADFNADLDTAAKNWADTTLLNLKTDDIAKVELSFDSGARVTVTGDKKDGAWTAVEAPAGRKVSVDKISSVLSSLGALHFSDTSDSADPQVAAARQHVRTFTLTAFDGTVTTIALGQKPAEKKPAASGKPAAEAEPAAIPANPVYVFISSSQPEAPINGLMRRRAFQVDDYTLTSLPQKPDELFEPAAK